MGRNRNYDYDEDEEFDSGWGQEPGETDEDYEERMDDWNDSIDYSND